MRTLTLAAAILVLWVVSGNRPAANGFNHEVTAERIVQYYNSLWNLGVNVKITSGEVNYSDRNGEIILSRPYLDQIMNRYGPKVYPFCVSFLLAHEYAHQRQFREHPASLLNTASCEQRTLLEAQADVLAGYLFANMWKLGDTLRLQDTVTANSFRTVMAYVYDMGTYEFGLNTHPGYKQRRNAFRHGLVYGQLEGNSSEERKRYLASVIMKTDNTDLWPWSLDIAKKIVHFPSVILQDIAILADSIHYRFHDDERSTMVYYEQKLRNNGKRKIRLTMQYKVIGVDTNYYRDPKQIALQGGVKNHIVEIAPGAEVTLSGDLDWRNASRGAQQPTLRFPPDNDVLFSAAYVDGEPELDDLCRSAGARFHNDRQTPGNRSLPLSLMFLGREGVKNFRNLRAGFSLEWSGDFIDFSCSHEVPGALETTVSKYLEDSTVSVQIRFYDAYSKQDARKIFNELIGTLLDMEKKKYMFIERDYEDLFERIADKGGGEYLGSKHSLEKGYILKRDNKFSIYENVKGEFLHEAVSLTSRNIEFDLEMQYWKRSQNYTITLEIGKHAY
ncbi:hypothetical protein [Chitinophaga sp. 22620]|uniref:hypothetical protein n=1 Tax=Chitinophaga sp. 22620 TaxID=3453952 RepID=UPI003F826EB8